MKMLAQARKCPHMLCNSIYLGPKAILRKTGLITSKEIEYLSKISYSEETENYFRATLPSQSTLDMCKEFGMAIIAGPPSPMSILDMEEIFPGLLSTDEDWYEDWDEEFMAKDTANTEWIPFKCDHIRGSLCKNLERQLMLLSPLWRVPNAAEVVWCLAIYFEINRKRLMENSYIRTSSTDRNNDNVAVGKFDRFGIRMVNYANVCEERNIGIAAALRL